MTSRSDTREASVDNDVLAGDKRVLRAREPGDERRDLLRLPQPPRRDDRDELLHGLLVEIFAGELGVDETRRDAIGEDSLGGDLDRESRRQPVESELAHAVGRPVL